MSRTVKDIMEYCQGLGILMYEQYDEHDARKRHYKLSIPEFEDGRVTPVSNREYIADAKTCYRYVRTLLNNDAYKAKLMAWKSTW